ncbi:MAG: hypothetical protein QM820_49520 [Minicystis sp.]
MRVRLLSTLGALLLVPVFASCAKGSGLSGIGGSGAEGGGGSTSTSTTTSASSATSASSSSSTTSSSGSTSTSSSSTSASSSSGSSCPDPCKLTNPQCGCGAGEACTIENYAITCSTPGPDAVNQACGTSASDQCQAGGICVSASTTVGQCLAFCDSDSQCLSGGLCAVTLADGPNSMNSIPGVTLCSPGCNPISGTGCPAGSGCGLGLNDTQNRWFGICGPAGTKTQGQSCTVPADCAATYTCLDPDGSSGAATPVCMRYCNADLVTGCPSGLLCYGLQDQSAQDIVVGGVTIGVCF